MTLQVQGDRRAPGGGPGGPAVVVRLLGPLAVELDGVSSTPASGRVSALLALLALEAGRVVSVDRLMDQLWGDEPPSSGAAGLHVYVSRLRRLLAGTGARVVTRTPGYLLDLPGPAVDVHLLAAQLAAAEEAAAAGRWAPVLELAGPARALWRGSPFLDAHPCADLQAEAERLERLRDRLDELAVRALLALERCAEAQPLAVELCRRNPLDETGWWLRMRAEHGAGDDARALHSYEEFRTLLVQELGLDPGERMRQLQAEVLRAGAAAPDPPPPPGALPVPARAANGVERSLTGRAVERGELERAVRGARDGAGRTVVVEGEPGIGKTFLAAHAAALARDAGVRVVWARASEGPGSPPWWLWEQVLDVLEADAADAPGLEQRSGAAALRRLVEAGADEDADRARFRLCLALVERVARAARADPLLVVLDDVQWADDGTLQAVRLLAQQLSRTPCSLVLTARTGAGRSAALDATLAAVGREESASRHRLVPFSPAEVLSYLDGLGEGRSDLEDVTGLHQRSGGNPFFLGELVRAGAAVDGPPETVTGVVRQRLAVLTGPAQAVLEVAAVAGSTFAVPVVAWALERPPRDVVALLEPAVTEGFVVLDAESARWRFVHDLAREAILDALPTSRRAELHGRVGDALAALHADELHEHVDALADHRFRASLGVPSEEAFVACTAAADRAGRRLSYDQAALHRGRALVCLPPGPDRRRERFEVLLRLTAERRAAGDVVGASASLQQAVELARLVDDRVLLARAVAVLGGVTLWNWRQFEQVDHETVALLEDLLTPPGPDPAPAHPDQVRRRVELLGTLAVELYYDDARPHGEQHAVEAVRLARTTGDAALLGRALNNHVIAAWRPGRDADRLASLDESLALAGRGLPLATEVVARLHRASLRLAAADLAGSERDLERASRLAPRLGLLEVEGQVTAQHAGLALLRGELGEASELVERAHGQLARTSLWGADWVRLVQLTTRARLDRQAGRVAEALVAKASEDAHRPLRWTAVLALAEAGQLAQARDLQARWGLRTLGRRPYWGSTFAWAQAAETSLLLGTPDPGAVYAALAPFAGQLVVAGTSVAVWGPVAGLLARLAEVRGEPAAAAHHARQAAALTRRVGAQLGFSPTWPAAAR